MLLNFTAYRAARRALVLDQKRVQPCSLPMWRLVAGEILVLARRFGRWRFAGVTAGVFGSILLVQVALLPSTPGPVLSNPWRWAVAAVISSIGLAVWSMIHALQQTRAQSSR